MPAGEFIVETGCSIEQRFVEYDRLQTLMMDLMFRAAELYEAWGRSGDATKLRMLIAGKKEKKSD